jgi:PKD repeat protein
VLTANVLAATPTAVISASPVAGAAPLGTFFDGSASTNVSSLLWEFGDGSVSTGTIVSHIYNVAGTYTATLTVTSDDGKTATSQVVVTVSGSGEGVVSANTNFRWAPISGSLNLNFAKGGSDSFTLSSTFNTVDVPSNLSGLAASFTLNGTSIASGIMDEYGVLVSASKARPEFLLQLNSIEQTLFVSVKKTNLAAAVLAAGATNTTVLAPGVLVPLTFRLTVGAQTYELTEFFTYTATAGVKGLGRFNLKKAEGSVSDGFFAIALVSALENATGTGHFYEFSGYLTRPGGLILTAPTSGNCIFRFNNADPLVIPFDRFRLSGDRVVYEQSNRDLGGIKSLVYDNATRLFTLRTWDLVARETLGGTGLPLRSDAFVGYNFSLRMDLDQPDGTTFSVVTATRLTRRSKDDAFWQTGRSKKRH